LPLSESLAPRLHRLLQLLRQLLLRLHRLPLLPHQLLRLHRLLQLPLQLLQPQRPHLHQLQLQINCCRRLCAGWLLSTALT
jgi:hypothetical protein